MEFKVGDRAVLTTDKHGVSERNPVWDSIYQCAGTVIAVRASEALHSSFPLSVEWDNGNSNIYDYPDLSPFELEQTEASNPNATFRKMFKNGCYYRYKK